MDSKLPCIWCGKTYDEHEDSRKEGDPVPKTPCLLLKENFKDVKTTSPVKKTQELRAAMTFGEAMTQLSQGAKITRIEWNNVEEYGQLYIGWLMIYRNNKYNVWQVSDGDLLANDWIILTENN